MTDDGTSPALVLTREQSRRIAVRAQLLDGSASTILDTIKHLRYLQIDPTNRVARTQLLVLWSRLGGYDPSELDRLLWVECALFEWRAFIYPMDDLPAIRALMRRHATEPGRVLDWMHTNESFRGYVLEELRRRGPLRSRDLEDRAALPWASTGWTGNRNVSQMLEFLWARGEIAVVGREGAQRVWDLAERWYPDVEPLPDAEAERVIAARTLQSLGIARTGPGISAAVAGLPGTWAVDPRYLETLDTPLPDRTTLLSPFDRLIHDRVRTQELFDFRYRLEMYVPRDQREHGYFVLPVLRGDQLIGRIDPEMDRKRRVLRIHAVYAEPGVPEDAGEHLADAVRDLAAWLTARDVVYDGPVPPVWAAQLR